MTTNHLLIEWKELQLKCVAAREAYRVSWAAAYNASQLKTETQRKAEADLHTTMERLARDTMEAEATASWQAFLVSRGPLDHSLQPGVHRD